jgi:hypothetical protein
LDQHITLWTVCKDNLRHGFCFWHGFPQRTTFWTKRSLWESSVGQSAARTCKKKGAEYPQGRPFVPKGHPFELAKF